MAPPAPVVPPAGLDAGGQEQHQQHQMPPVSNQVADNNNSQAQPHFNPLPDNVESSFDSSSLAQGFQGLSIRGSTAACPAGHSRRWPGADAAPSGTGSEPRRDDDAENSQPAAGWTVNPAAAGAAAAPAPAPAPAAAAAPAPAAAGNGNNRRGANSSVTGPEVDDWPPQERSAVAAPLSDNQQHATDANNEPGAGRWSAADDVGRTTTNSRIYRRGGGAGAGARAEGGGGGGKGGVEMEMWKLGLHIGSKLDVKDTVDKWCEASVIAVDREAGKVLVTYTYWAPKVRGKQ